MGLESFSTHNENDLKQKEMELVREGFQHVSKNRLDPGDYKITDAVDPETSEAIFTIEWMDYDYTSAAEQTG